MGYSEDYCHICGVGFNIARIRKATHDEDGELEEPSSASWSTDNSGEFDFVEVDLDNDEIMTACGPDSGCKFIDREQSNFPESPFEGPPPFGEEGMRLPPTEMPHEHLAGPGCKSVQGYNGHKISVEEMRGCRVLQCLNRKGPDFTPAPDDEDFERTGEWFLTGLIDGMPDAEMRFDNDVKPARHGKSSTDPQNCLDYISDQEQLDDVGIPFHPYCLEVYKRVAKLRTGDIDIAGLTGWYEQEADYHTFHSFPRNGPTTSLQEQWWSHEAGTEWVVANPLYLPHRFSEILQSAISTDPNFDPNSGAFNIPTSAPTSSSQEDPFTLLPAELSLQILTHLPSSSIASLRLSSRAFRQLPQTLFHHLLRTETPWLWEASLPSSSTSEITFPYSFWTSKTHSDFAQNTRDVYSPSKDYRPIPVPDVLPPHQTNWYMLSLEIKRNWNELLGLRNRERIWMDCEEIVRRIAKYREAGQIPVRDVMEVIREREEERRNGQ